MSRPPNIERAFLTIHYLDQRRQLETWRVYEPDGKVHLFDGQDWRQDYRLSADDIAQIKQTLGDCGLFKAKDLHDANISDSATFVWSWQWSGQKGEVTNHAYPAVEIPAMQCGMDFLLDLENRYESEAPDDENPSK